jgi:[ribosomal protein S5]-alanine N-acetyltransferase
MILTTERLILRPFRASDYADVHDYAADPQVTRYTSFGPNSPEETRDFLSRSDAEAKSDPRHHFNFAITLRDADRAIGGAGFVIDHPLHRAAEMGYVLHRGHWGRGIATEAAEAVVRYAMATVGLHRIVARCHPENTASAGVMRKIGMQYEGRQREVMWMKGAWWDFLVYSILEHEWKERNGVAPAAFRDLEEIL